MERPERKQGKTEAPALAGELLSLYGEIAEFNDCCVREAFCSLAAEEQSLNTSTIEGLKCLSYWMKQRGATVKVRLKDIHERAVTETQSDIGGVV